MSYTDIKNKYDGKTIRIGKYVYQINVSGLTVELSPMDEIGDIASSEESTQDYSYTHGGDAYREAVNKAWKIKEEIEKSFETDF